MTDSAHKNNILTYETSYSQEFSTSLYYPVAHPNVQFSPTEKKLRGVNGGH